MYIVETVTLFVLLDFVDITIYTLLCVQWKLMIYYAISEVQDASDAFLYTEDIYCYFPHHN